MDYLEPPLKHADDKVQALHDLLAQAYPTLADAQLIAKKAGLRPDLLPSSAQDMALFWWETMEAMADAGLLPQLVKIASEDEERKGYWPRFKQHLSPSPPPRRKPASPARPAAETTPVSPEPPSPEPPSPEPPSPEPPNPEPPLSRRTAVIIAAIGFLVAILLLLGMVIAAPALAQSAIVTEYFYVLLVILGVAVAALVFGAMRSSAAVTYKSQLGVIDLAGPMAGIVVIVAGFFLLAPPGSEPIAPVPSTCATLSIDEFTVNDGTEEWHIPDGGTYSYAQNTLGDEVVIRPLLLQEPVACARLAYQWELLTPQGAVALDDATDEKLVLSLSADGAKTKIRLSVVDEPSKNQASAILNLVPTE